jgi:glucose-1-phosphate thymidylyltransferase
MNSNSQREVIGLIPAAGKASRLPLLPCSKELYPIGYNSRSFYPKVISQFLLENMRAADIKRAYIILRKGKWDIPAYFGDGKMLDMRLAYLLMDLPYGVPYTLDQAYPFVQNAIIALGFPDIIFKPADAYSKLLTMQRESDADVILGLFSTSHPHKTDMVDFDDSGRIRSIHIKPSETHLKYAWGIAVWGPSFTKFMHDYVLSQCKLFENNAGNESKREMFVGDVIQTAIENGMQVDPVIFKNGSYVDIGTPEDLIKAVRTTSKIVI